MKAVIIPGNPPSKYFYDLWRSELLEERIFDEVIYKSYPVFSSKSPEDYLEECVSFYESILHDAQATGGEVVIIGHSFGGFITTEILRRNKGIKHSFILFPFLGRPGLKGRVILNLASFASKFLASSLIILLKKIGHFVSKDLKLIENSEILSSIAMARHERHFLGKRKIIKPINDLGNISYFYTDNDTWSPYSVAVDSQAIELHHCPEISHGFIVCEKERKTMSKRIEKSLILN